MTTLTVHIAKGAVTDAEAHGDNIAALGDTEWQASMEHPDDRSMSYDFLTIEDAVEFFTKAYPDKQVGFVFHL